MGKLVNFEAEQHRVVIAKLYLSQLTQAEIGKQLGISQQTVSKHLKVIKERWKQSANDNFDGVLSVELQRIDRLERQHWEAWERSQSEGRDGDPRFLSGIDRCIERRCKLLGLEGKQSTVSDEPKAPMGLFVVPEILEDAEWQKLYNPKS